MADKSEAIGDCKERVAFDMAMTIANTEQKATQEEFRQYFLELFKQCLSAVDRRG